MPRTTVNATPESEVSILARVFNNGDEVMPAPVARYVLTLGFSDRDQERMHDLATRNQEGALSPAEKEELLAYAKAGSLLSLLHSKARRVLGVKPKPRGHV